MADTAQLAAMIGEVPIFKGLDRKTLNSVVTEGKERAFNAGDLIVGEGGSGIGLYVILDGKAEVRKGAKVLATLAKGQFFGEMSVIDGQPRSADVAAVAETRCWVLTAWNFTGLVKAHPDIALAMLKEMVRRFRASQSTPTS